MDVKLELKRQAKNLSALQLQTSESYLYHPTSLPPLPNALNTIPHPTLGRDFPSPETLVLLFLTLQILGKVHDAGLSVPSSKERSQAWKTPVTPVPPLTSRTFS